MPTLRPSSEPLGSRLYRLRQARKLARERFLAGRKAETYYRRQLLKVSDQIDSIVKGMAPDGIVANVGDLVAILNRYADILAPWGESVAARMAQDVAKRDGAAWAAHGREIGRALRKEIEGAPTGQAFREAIAQQVQEITSLPRKAAQRLYQITTEAQINGTRAAEIAKKILATGHVTRSEAKMLARTGVSSTSTAMTRARAEHIGSEGYFWRTSKDGAVRPSHRQMESKFVRWDSPPTLDNYTAHAGCYANCRCFPEVQVPDRRA